MIGFGSKLEYNSAVGSTYTKIAKSIKVLFPPLKVDRKDMTNNDSPVINNAVTVPGTIITGVGQGVRQKEPGLVDPGEITITFRYTAAVYALLLTFVGLPAFLWRITLRDGTMLVNSFFVGDLGMEGDMENEIDISLTLVSSGIETETPGTQT